VFDLLKTALASEVPEYFCVCFSRCTIGCIPLRQMSSVLTAAIAFDALRQKRLLKPLHKIVNICPANNSGI
jgi:hypothetical protein